MTALKLCRQTAPQTEQKSAYRGGFSLQQSADHRLPSFVALTATFVMACVIVAVGTSL